MFKKKLRMNNLFEPSKPNFTTTFTTSKRVDMVSQDKDCVFVCFPMYPLLEHFKSLGENTIYNIHSKML